MINDSKPALINRIREMLTDDEWLICLFSSLPNIFTEELLIWCLRDELNAEIIKTSILQLVKLGFIHKQLNKENICFYTMHDRFRQIMNDKEDIHYTTFCRNLVNYYTNYIALGKAFSNQYYNDKLFYQLILNDNTEWRHCYQYIFEKGNHFESEKLLNIYKKAISPNNKILYAWYQYYKLQEEVNHYKICTLETTILNHSAISNAEFNTYWFNICGVLHIKCGKYKEAEKHFISALMYANKTNESYIIQYNMCFTYCYKKQYMKAFDLLTQICDATSSEDLFYLINYKLLRAIINMHLCKLNTALMQFEEVLNLKELYQTQLRYSQPLYLCQKKPRPLCVPIDKNIYNYMGEIYLTQGKFQQAIQYHLKGLQYNKTFGNLSGLAWANNDLGKAYYISGDTHAAKKHLKESIRLFKRSNDKLSIAYPLMELSYVYQYNGDVEKTIFLLKKSFFLLKQKGVLNDMLSSLNNLGRLYQSQGFLNASKIIFDFCLTESKKQLSVQQNLGWINNNLARNYLYLNDYENAITYFEIALNIFKKTNEKRGYIYVLNNIGETYAKQRKYDDSLELLINSCHQKEEMGDMHGICYSYREIGELYLKLNQPKTAFSYINKAYDLCEQGNFIMLKGDIWISFGNYYLKERHLDQSINSYMKALDNYKKQNFYSRVLSCSQKINELIQEYHYTNMNLLNMSCIYRKLEEDENMLTQELQGLLNNFFEI